MKLTVTTNLKCPFCGDQYHFLDLRTVADGNCQLIFLRCLHCRSQVKKHISRFMTIIPKSETEMEIGFDRESYEASDYYKQKQESLKQQNNESK